MIYARLLSCDKNESHIVKDINGEMQVENTYNQYGNVTSVTDSAGGTLQSVSYDPWGNIVDDESGRLLSRDEQPELLLERGFTGHEHLPHFGLINMNARLYEPLTARFLSPDPEVQAPDFTQNLNRYSYCLNNPLRYTAPSGMIVYCDTVGMTEQEKTNWLEFKRFVDENELMRDIYDRLDGDLNVSISFSFGSLGDEGDALFDPNKMVIIYNNSPGHLGIRYSALIEEFIHAYQFFICKMIEMV